jgi:chorismate mutase/prephenate dehydratase
MEDIRQLRDAIDTIDAKLLALLNDRARIAQEIGRVKERNGAPVYVPERAEQLIRRLSEQSAGPLNADAIRAIYVEIMSASLALEKEMLVACEGEAGCESHFAARQQFGSSIRFSFHPGPKEVVEAILSGGADCGVVAEGPADITPLLEGGNLRVLSRVRVDHADHTAFLVLGRAQSTL